MSEERFIEIEMKLSHQEVLLSELHQVLYKQQETIDTLEKKMKAVMKDMESHEGPANKKPPHY
jgi:SlyX protein